VESDTIIFRYQEDRNPHGASLPGVPLRNLTLVDVQGYQQWLIDSIGQCGFYMQVAAPPQPEVVAPAEADGSVPEAVQEAARRQRRTGPSETKAAEE
jgi:hypothetical protein